ncbi:MAG: hypothetical protein KME55_23150 [Nostoc indistinguendum CM1-VF10]|jgi:hypothetical protein|nr:hypothetical protein [Nostoc indistinguendum CM1-VF10]
MQTNTQIILKVVKTHEVCLGRRDAFIGLRICNDRTYESVSLRPQQGKLEHIKHIPTKRSHLVIWRAMPMAGYAYALKIIEKLSAS